MTTETHLGGCQCGAVRYRITGPFGRAGICHCRMCQKAFGSWGAPLVSVLAVQVEWTREAPAEFRSSAVVARGFCRRCGTPLFMREDNHPGYEISIGSLDDPNSVQPTEQVGIEGKVSWFDGMVNLPAHRTEDERTPEDLVKLKTLQHPDHDTDRWPPP